jgi:hypothetical protein
MEILFTVHNCMHMYNQVLVYVYTSPTCVSSVLRRNEDPCSGVDFLGIERPPFLKAMVALGFIAVLRL